MKTVTLGEAQARTFTSHKTASQAERYTHRRQLAVRRQVVEKMPGFNIGTPAGTPIGTHATVKNSRFVSQTVAGGKKKKASKSGENSAFPVVYSLFYRMTPTGFEPVLPG